jgi:hypothetical protein
MSASLAPTIWDLAKDKFNSIAKRRRVPEDPEWATAKRISVMTVSNSLFAASANLPDFLLKPDMVSVVSIAFSARAAVDATVNCVKTFRAARQSAVHLADPSEPQPALTPAESQKKSFLVSAFSLASVVPNALNAGDSGHATIFTGMALACYGLSRIGPRGPGE